MCESTTLVYKLCFFTLITVTSISSVVRNGSRTVGSYVQAGPVNKSAMSSLEFVVSGVIMKIFCTKSIPTLERQGTI